VLCLFFRLRDAAFMNDWQRQDMTARKFLSIINSGRYKMVLYYNIKYDSDDGVHTFV